MNSLPESLGEGLCILPSEEEVYQAIHDMAPWKSLSLDGMTTGFFHKRSPIIKHDVVKLIQDLFLGHQNVQEFNVTYICLLLKMKPVKYPPDTRPICLCKVAYKILSKVLSNRLTEILSILIDENQEGFLKGRGMTNNAIYRNGSA